MLVRGPESVDKWREQNSYQVPGAEWSPQYRAGHWDGIWKPGRWCRVLNDGTWEMRCSVGLLQRVVRELQPVEVPQVGAEPILIDEYCKTPVGSKFFELYEHLQPAFRDALLQGWGRVAMATNAGKGAVIALLAAYAKHYGLNALVLCDELAVYDALQGEIKKWAKLVPFRVQAGRTAPPAAGVTLAMVPTLAKRLRSRDRQQRAAWQVWLSGQHMVLADEADKALADMWRTIMRGATGSWWRIGFSGTFQKDPYSDIRLDDLMGAVIAEVRNKELIDAGVSARPLVELHGFDCTAALRGIRFTFRVRGAARRQMIFERAIMRNEARHAAIASLVRENTPTAVIVNRVQHGKLLARAIPGAVFLDGSAAQDERLEILKQFAGGKIRVLVVTKILDRGTNRLGVAADLIFASGEGSTTQTLQRLGRGLRRTGGKAYLRLVDIIDRVVPDGDEQLEEAAEFVHVGGRKRTQLYADEGFDSEIIP